MSTAATEKVWTLGDLLDWTAREFAKKQLETARLDAEVLLAHVVGCKRIDLYGIRHGEVASPARRCFLSKSLRACSSSPRLPATMASSL